MDVVICKSKDLYHLQRLCHQFNSEKNYFYLLGIVQRTIDIFICTVSKNLQDTFETGKYSSFIIYLLFIYT